MPTRPTQTTDAQLQRWRDRRKQVGSRIREIRISQELSQEALGLEAGMSRNMIIGIEWGRRSIAYERLWDIADVLRVDLRDLFTPPPYATATEPQRKGRVKSSTGVRRSAGPDAK
ncbi:XRE family transcriptional regulator [Arthrobacter sp. H-02-3]|nr:XRE family transcriptional regulator [Arthrobacter sp. H-02-3]